MAALRAIVGWRLHLSHAHVNLQPLLEIACTALPLELHICVGNNAQFQHSQWGADAMFPLCSSCFSPRIHLMMQNYREHGLSEASTLGGPRVWAYRWMGGSGSSRARGAPPLRHSGTSSFDS